MLELGAAVYLSPLVMVEAGAPGVDRELLWFLIHGATAIVSLWSKGVYGISGFVAFFLFLYAASVPLVRGWALAMRGSLVKYGSRIAIVTDGATWWVDSWPAREVDGSSSSVVMVGNCMLSVLLPNLIFLEEGGL